MVERKKRVLLGKQHFNKDSRLGIDGDYYECSVCMEVPASCKILECPICSGRACENCIDDFIEAQKKNTHTKEDER
jgi:hypothetical protein